MHKRESKHEVEGLTSSDVTGKTGSNNIMRSLSDIHNNKQLSQITSTDKITRNCLLETLEKTHQACKAALKQYSENISYAALKISY